MKSKLAVFDFDLTIRDPDPGNDWSYGVSHLFPGKEILESFLFRMNLGSLGFSDTRFGYNGA